MMKIKKLYPEYSVDFIENIMSLRKPQKRSVKILHDILDEVELSKDIDLASARDTITDVYPIFKDFEHDFLSLTFALATGVGKTKLMGAFITYLYTNKGIRNFFIVAPNLTIYKKLKNDLGNPSADNHKYVFKGVGCLATAQPNVWVDDDYRTRPIHGLADSDSINIYIFNISKFNSDERKMKSLNEYIGKSFFDYLSSLDDLVVIMDESHHYRAQNSAEAINQLRPVLGLELTATPQVQVGSKPKLFQNVVYEYELSKAIKDGYTRTPYALTRKDVKAYNLSDEELDKTMINDGVLHHENMKKELLMYATNNNVRLVKPFMLIVCKDTKHAEGVLDYIKSNAFREGYYKDKVIMVHSNQKGSEKEENIQLLLDVEQTENPLEIVIHVNILKEGWDVNNLYTIVPLRTATSKTLREQTVGRGLRLPYGKRTGENMIDSVTITAHDKFDEIIEEAQKGDSIFHAEGVIFADYQESKRIQATQINIEFEPDVTQQILTKAGVEQNKENEAVIANVIATITDNTQKAKVNNPTKPVDKAKVIEQSKKDIGERYKDNTDLQKLLETAFGVVAEDTVEKAEERTMYIPKIKTEQLGEEQYIIADFDLDLSSMVYVPILDDIMIKNMLDTSEDVKTFRGIALDINTLKPEKYLVDAIRCISEIDYEKCPELIQKIVLQFLNHYRCKYTESEVRNICLMYRKDIVHKLGIQLLQHLAVKYDDVFETVQGIETIVKNHFLDTTSGLRDLYQTPGKDNIKSLTYQGGKKSAINIFKFDSDPERLFAIACENSPEVIQWLRPSPKQFNITYNRGKRYEPDFVVETADMYYLVEVKDKSKMSDPTVIAKKERALQYCRIATDYNVANGHKGFRYLFIPHDEISGNSSFDNLRKRFEEG